MSKIPQEAIEALDWVNFDEIKLNREWLPDDQELIYTAINAYNGEGDMDDDCLEQIIERLLLAWRRTDATRAQRAEIRQSNLRATFEALCAMRNDINEYIPPSEP